MAPKQAPQFVEMSPFLRREAEQRLARRTLYLIIGLGIVSFWGLLAVLASWIGG